jgi:hypothetical protein
MKSGDVKRGADVEVLFVRSTPEFEASWKELLAGYRSQVEAAREVLRKATDEEATRSKEHLDADRAMLAAVTQFGGGYSDAAKKRSDAFTRYLDSRSRTRKAKTAVFRVVTEHQHQALALLQKSKVAAVRADVNGRYAKSELEPGSYYIYAAHRVFDNTLFWYVPVEISRGTKTRLDLSGSNAGWAFDEQ